MESNRVDVWLANLQVPASRLQGLWQTLTDDELARADRFFFEKDRIRFVVARGALRNILGRYLNRAPNFLRFDYSPYGKPELSKKNTGGSLCFNLSHSCGRALFVVACDREVGVDLEKIRSDFSCKEIAQRFFSPREIAAIQDLPAAMQMEAFFNCWTRKEAYLKARGEGLSEGLDRFEVSVTGGPAALIDTADGLEKASQWSLQTLYPGDGYVAALAVEGHGWKLNCWQWNS